MLPLEVLALLDERGNLDDLRIAENLGSFGLLNENHSAMHPGLRHPRYRVSTVSLDEIRHTIRILAGLDLVRAIPADKRTLYQLTRLGKMLLTELSAQK
jgi:hypothetical protein